MATLVSFHAHPDDEAIAVGGTLAKAVRHGHRVVLVVATRGEHGEVPEGLLAPGETLAERRMAETAQAAAILGIHRVEFLGYADSGLPGDPANQAAGSFWSAGTEEAAARLAAILREEDAGVLTVYPENGVTGHPDHVKVHHVGVRAAELAATPRVYESTVSRGLVQRVLARARRMGIEGIPEGMDLDRIGTPEELITTVVDVREVLDVKRAGMAAHRSQISEDSFFLSEWLDPAEIWGTEWFIRRGAPPGLRETSLLEGRLR